MSLRLLLGTQWLCVAARRASAGRRWPRQPPSHLLTLLPAVPGGAAVRLLALPARTAQAPLRSGPLLFSINYPNGKAAAGTRANAPENDGVNKA